MTLTHHSNRHRVRIMKTLTLTVAGAGVALLVQADGHAQGASPSSQEHQVIENQLTTHNGNQTTQHNALSQKIDALSTSADLSGLPPDWNKTLPANDGPDSCHSSRFTCVMGNAAVRDNETGLVWEQSPANTGDDWVGARNDCLNRTVGGRKGWRLPSVPELASLVDISHSSPSLAPGHPFTNVQSSNYWSATTNADNPNLAWQVLFSDGIVSTGGKSDTFVVWCVRGAMQESVY